MTNQDRGVNEILIANKEGTQLAKLANGRGAVWVDPFDIQTQFQSTAVVAQAPVSESATITSPLSVTTSGQYTKYTISGTATSPVPKLLNIDLGGGIINEDIGVQTDGTWASVLMLSAGRYPIVLRFRDPSTSTLGRILTTGTLTVGNATIR